MLVAHHHGLVQVALNSIHMICGCPPLPFKVCYQIIYEETCTSVGVASNNPDEACMIDHAMLGRPTFCAYILLLAAAPQLDMQILTSPATM